MIDEWRSIRKFYRLILHFYFENSENRYFAATNIHAIIIYTLIVLNKQNFMKEIVETPANQAIM
jgi:hypothetical protein